MKIRQALKIYHPRYMLSPNHMERYTKITMKLAQETVTKYMCLNSLTPFELPPSDHFAKMWAKFFKQKQGNLLFQTKTG